CFLAVLVVGCSNGRPLKQTTETTPRREPARLSDRAGEHDRGTRGTAGRFDRVREAGEESGGGGTWQAWGIEGRQSQGEEAISRGTLGDSEEGSKGALEEEAVREQSGTPHKERPETITKNAEKTGIIPN